MKKNLTVIIPTLNNYKGLKYLLNYYKDKDFKIVIIDNRPEKNKINLVNKVSNFHKIELKYLPQNKNLGFAKAVNLGSKYADTEWMLILNDDIKFQYQISNIKYQKDKLKIKYNKKDQIKELIDFAEDHKLVAASPLLRNPDGKIENYGYKILPYGKVELINNPGNIPNTEYGILNTNIDGLTAACLLIKTEIFKKLHGFDESFFAYLEDVDFFIRLKKLVNPLTQKPYNFAMDNDLTALHNHLTTSKTMGNFKSRQDMINWWRLYFKHPDRFKFNLAFIIERLRNVSGYLKATFKNNK